jgi:leader peptidase (prepilin peptidase)/N-methyltransferase
MLALLIAGCATFGLAIGSFLNVVIYRVPQHLSIVTPRSACPNCHAPILERDNIPVVSWLLLKGRCRQCHNPISKRYPLVELACAALFGGAAAKFGFNWDLPAFLVLLASLLALASIDFERMLLPKLIVWPSVALVGTLLVLASALDHRWHDLLVAGICAAAWFLLFFALNFASPRYLGFGDVRLAPLLGLSLGWLGWEYVLLGFFVANLAGALVGVTLIAMKRMKRDQQIPYGVFLAFGTAFAIFTGSALLAPFHSLH